VIYNKGLTLKKIPILNDNERGSPSKENDRYSPNKDLSYCLDEKYLE